MSRLASLYGELRQRRVARALLAYGAGVAAVLQGTDMLFTALALPDLAYRIIIIAALAGFPLVATLSWAYDLTAQGLRRAETLSAAERNLPVPPARYLQLVGAFTVAALIVASTAGAVSQLRHPSSDDQGRVGLAIFPLRVAGAVDAGWSEGAADLLATALEGTPSLRIVDPWSLWSSLRPRPGAAARAPDADEAQALAMGSGAHRFLLGSVVRSGDGFEVAFRLYRVGRSEPMDAFTVSAGPDDLSLVVRRAAVRVLARAWGPLRPADIPAELDFDATQDPEALKAYLAAREALRRGAVDSANTAIDRSLALDSAFVLAMLGGTVIKSWAAFVRGQPFTGLIELLARAEPFERSLPERSRLRLEGIRASVRTDGATAIRAASRILELDSLDYGATSGLAYFRLAYGWQLNPPAYGSRELMERVVRLDSTQAPALALRAWFAVALGDSADQRVQMERLSRIDTTGTLARSTLLGLRSLLADSAEYERMLPSLAVLPQVEWIAVARALRMGRVGRYRLLLEATSATPGAPAHAEGVASRLRLDIAQGWAARADSLPAAGLSPEEQWNVQDGIEMLLVGADLSGLGDRPAAERAIASLAGYVPIDSALAYFNDRNVWQTGWLIGAWNAQLGDTAVARRWTEAIATFPGGGTSDDYRGALRSDIGSRLAERAGDRERALALAREAMTLWTIHTDNGPETGPSPMLRLHLAGLLQAAGEHDRAAAIYSSLVPPTAWMGFLTVRASFELGTLAAESGAKEEAARHFRRVLELLEGAGPAARDWAERARTGLEATERGTSP